MIFEMRIPSLGESVTEAAIGRWLKNDGERVEVDEPLLELESDKANMELAAEASGVLRILKPAGDTVGVGELIARIEAGAGAAVAGAPPTPAGPAAPLATPTITPATPRAAEQVVNQPRDATGRPVAPSVQRIAEESGIDVATIPGTGPGGRVTKADALTAASAGAASKSAGHPSAAVSSGTTTSGATAAPSNASRAASTGTTAPTAPTGSTGTTAVNATSASPVVPAAASPLVGICAEPRGERRVRMSRIRQVIARRLVEAQHTAAILTTFNEIDMSPVMELRRRHKEAFEKQHGVALGFMSFFVKACCAAARAVPELNAQIQGDELVYREFVHMGVAVGTEHGLVVPVVRNADQLSFAGIETEIARLAALARDGHLMPDHLSGATFTISNGGVYGSLLSTPILNPPQSGILGMHKIEKRPIVVNDEIVVRPMMYLALSYDHRVVDGKGAVTFLVRVKEALEDPSRLLLGI